MSGLVMGLVWELPFCDGFKTTEKYVLLAYADHADQAGGNIYPSNDLICQKTGYSERTVRATTRTLEALGYLVHEGMGINGTNRFRIPVKRTKDGGAIIAPLPVSQIAPEEIAPEPSVVVKDLKDNDNESRPPEIFREYENNIGPITPMLADQLRDAEKTYPRDWIMQAFRVAVENNARNWRYIQACLTNMQAHGPGWKPTKPAASTRAGGKPKQDFNQVRDELAAWLAEGAQ